MGDPAPEAPEAFNRYLHASGTGSPLRPERGFVPFVSAVAEVW